MFAIAAKAVDPGWTWSNTLSLLALAGAIVSLIFVWRNDRRSRDADRRAERAEKRADAAHELAQKADERQERAERRSAVRWVIERDDMPDWYRVRNLGVEPAERVKIDAESVATVAVNTVDLYTLEPDQSAQFQLKADSWYKYPDDLRIMWGPHDDRQSAVVPFPKPPRPQEPATVQGHS